MRSASQLVGRIVIREKQGADRPRGGRRRERGEGYMEGTIEVTVARDALTNRCDSGVSTEV